MADLSKSFWLQPEWLLRRASMDYTGEDYPVRWLRIIRCLEWSHQQQYEAEGYSAEGLPEAYDSSVRESLARPRKSLRISAIRHGKKPAEPECSRSTKTRHGSSACFRIRPSSPATRSAKSMTAHVNVSLPRPISIRWKSVLDSSLSVYSLASQCPTPQAVSRSLAPAADQACARQVATWSKRETRRPSGNGSRESRSEDPRSDRRTGARRSACRGQVCGRRRDRIGEEGRSERGRDVTPNPSSAQPSV